jgi:hypothetical protein
MYSLLVRYQQCHTKFPRREEKGLGILEVQLRSRRCDGTEETFRSCEHGTVGLVEGQEFLKGLRTNGDQMSSRRIPGLAVGSREELRFAMDGAATIVMMEEGLELGTGALAVVIMVVTNRMKPTGSL